MTWQRFVLLPYLAGRDALSSSGARAESAQPYVWDKGIEAAVDWLCLTHDVTGRRGSSKGFSLVLGWAPAFPETTGYVIGTLLAAAARLDRPELTTRAREMGEWEVEVQCDDGGVMEGLLTEEPKPSTVFNTGMVIHGWLDLHADVPSPELVDAALRAGEFLVRNQDEDGAWRGEFEYFRIPHTYNARVSWALIRLGEVAGDDRFRTAATRQLDWVLTMQRENGWFDSCGFKPGMLPSTHSIAYTMRGLLESAALLGDDRYLRAARLTSEALIPKLDESRSLPATYNSDWSAGARYECLTGTVQLGGVWLRLHEITGDVRFLNAGLQAVERAASRQSRVGWAPVRGALAGSYPLYGRYAPLQYPNWATKFLVDGLMQRERALARLGTSEASN